MRLLYTLLVLVLGNMALVAAAVPQKEPATPRQPEPPKQIAEGGKPFVSQLVTKWGEKVTPENAWAEYPRPQLVRDPWTNLNGRWEYTVSPRSQAKFPGGAVKSILVPFCLESKLGGAQRLLKADEALWYRRTFQAKLADKRTALLHFEAVDYRCEVFVNGTSVGTHVGGHTPFSFDVTAQLKNGANEFVVRVEDETEGWQLRGKQTLEPRGIWYTRVSGIWQTVWLEFVPERHIADLKITTDAANGTIRLRPRLAGKGTARTVRVVARDGTTSVADVEGDAESLALTIKDAKRWTPDTPFLYDLEVTLLDDKKQPLDTVRSYAGIRTLGKVRDADGHLRFTLNGKEIFHWGPLDQGWWPDGLLTPPSDAAMKSDIEFLKAAGFNMIRKHIKVEPRRYYYHCDKLGMMVWQDHVSAGHNPKWTRLQPNPQDADWPDEHHQQWMLELERMIDTLENHPSIVMWVPFNEAWGQHRTLEVGRWAVRRDPRRPINIASGGNFWPVGDVVDAHKYPHPEFPLDEKRDKDFVKVMGEFGGHGWPVTGHLWDPNRKNWGYGDLPKTVEEYRERYAKSIRMLGELRAKGIAAGVYTQTTDVEGEINGLLTYDRRVVKIAAAELAKLHKPLLAARAPNGPKNQPPVPKPDEIQAALKAHDRAVFVKPGWIRDPYLVLASDGYYYLTGTTPLPDDPRQQEDPFNTGLGKQSIVGWKLQAWRSKDLASWESLGTPFSLKDGVWFTARSADFKKTPESQWRLWAPELHEIDGRWAIVHTSPSPVAGANLSFTKDLKLQGPFTNPMGEKIGRRHDPSLFKDDDGSWWLVWGVTEIAKLKKDFSDFDGQPVAIGPSGETAKMGHEGCLIRKIGTKYVLFGTGWSTGQMRKGSYNLYYATADKITGPYSERKFAGRFLGHGTPFQDKQGRWWCTAFYNANVPPLDRAGIETKDLGETAQTINHQGVTLVPLEVTAGRDGEVAIRAKDPAYATPGPDEKQKFDLKHPKKEGKRDPVARTGGWVVKGTETVRGKTIVLDGIDREGERETDQGGGPIHLTQK